MKHRPVEALLVALWLTGLAVGCSNFSATNNAVPVDGTTPFMTSSTSTSSPTSSSNENGPYSLPQGWRWVDLSSIAHLPMDVALPSGWSASNVSYYGASPNSPGAVLADTHQDQVGIEPATSEAFNELLNDANDDAAANSPLGYFPSPTTTMIDGMPAVQTYERVPVYSNSADYGAKNFAVVSPEGHTYTVSYECPTINGTNPWPHPPPQPFACDQIVSYIRFK